MHSLPKFVLYLFQFGEESLADGLAQHQEPAGLSGLSTDVREPQKVESLRLALPTLLPTCGNKTPELNQACLIRM